MKPSVEETSVDPNRPSDASLAVVRLLYNLAFPFVLLVLLPGFIVRMVRRGKYRHKFGQRFAVYSPRVRKKLAVGGWTWIHAVSVGEVMIAKKLIRVLKEEDPALRVVLSTTTSTGFALAAREKSPWLEPIYNPLDFVWIARRAVRLIRPSRLILVEAEVWPNLTAEARAQGAGLALVNARLSQRSERRYHLVRPLVAPIFGQIDLLCVQDPDDVSRWERLGVPSRRIVCPGSIKFDEEGIETTAARDFRPVLRQFGVTDGAPILLAGSTHAGEEVLVARIARDLRSEFPNLFCVVVPRHAERGRAVRQELEAAGLRVALRQGAEPVAAPDVLVVNTTGELRDWYACATVVFVGKSLTARGGQNPAEAIALGKAVVVGPHMENFPFLVNQLRRADGLVQVQDADGLCEAVRDLLRDGARREALAARGAECLARHHGATRRTCAALAGLKMA